MKDKIIWRKAPCAKLRRPPLSREAFLAVKMAVVSDISAAAALLRGFVCLEC